MLKKVGDGARMDRYSQGYVRNLVEGFAQDRQIWENKRWRDRPALCDGDGPVGALRRWYRQFYPETLEAAQAAAASSSQGPESHASASPGESA
jgi:hypothetical protein